MILFYYLSWAVALGNIAAGFYVPMCLIMEDGSGN